MKYFKNTWSTWDVGYGPIMALQIRQPARSHFSIVNGDSFGLAAVVSTVYTAMFFPSYIVTNFRFQPTQHIFMAMHCGDWFCGQGAHHDFLSPPDG